MSEKVESIVVSGRRPAFAPHHHHHGDLTVPVRRRLERTHVERRKKSLKSKLKPTIRFSRCVCCFESAVQNRTYVTKVSVCSYLPPRFFWQDHVRWVLVVVFPNNLSRIFSRTYLNCFAFERHQLLKSFVFRNLILSQLYNLVGIKLRQIFTFRLVLE